MRNFIADYFTFWGHSINEKIRLLKNGLLDGFVLVCMGPYAMQCTSIVIGFTHIE